ncbi:MAG: hypothetical protein CL840_07370 [Crocinitomicaceae bacterium]|nr:hypothetical protein [Crocinitomicaceae bacterium]|tara:strand:- start:7933 stop:8433 length:501 start_codon:yes stop_codon:yes gene_type:complete
MRILTVLLLITNLTLQAQIDKDSIAKNVVFIEAFGVGGYGSINYERILPLKSPIAFGFRIGVSTYYILDFQRNFNPDLIFPFGVNYIYGHDHRIELGIGQTLSSIVMANNLDGNAKRRTQLSATASLGYRYQPEIGGLFIRLVYSSIYERYTRFQHWGGLSFGYVF